MGHDRPIIAPDVEIVSKVPDILPPTITILSFLPLFLPDITRSIPVLPVLPPRNIIRVLGFPSILRARKIRRHARGISPQKISFLLDAEIPSRSLHLADVRGSWFSRNTEPEKSQCLTQAIWEGSFFRDLPCKKRARLKSPWLIKSFYSTFSNNSFISHSANLKLNFNEINHRDIRRMKDITNIEIIVIIELKPIFKSLSE